MVYEVTDDSGFLAVINSGEYSSFVDKDWELEQLFDHFKEQIKKRNLLIWGTGSENTWEVEVKLRISSLKGFREFVGFINVTNEKLCLTNYESLTMAAQFDDIQLPEKHQKELEFHIDNGLYQCRIIQMSNPELEEENHDSSDFVIEFQKVSEGENEFKQIPWCDFIE